MVPVPARSKSLPANPRNFVKGILKVKSTDDSLHTTYGEGKEDTTDAPKKKGIEFKDIEIREYGRTVGDNPSCSAGPPIT